MRKCPLVGVTVDHFNSVKRFLKTWLLKRTPSLDVKIFFFLNFKHQPFVKVKMHFLKAH